MVQPPELIDDAIAEILLRLPPDEPKHLFRASLVCKPWLRVLADPDFHRRYGAFHRTPPLLGYFRRLPILGGNPIPRLWPTTAAPLTPNPRFHRALDCHHGRVLLQVDDDDDEDGRDDDEDGRHLVVWDPVTGARQRVPEAGIGWRICTAAVFCAVTGCDHSDCHGGPFRVVFIASDHAYELKVSVYSSEAGVWSTPVILDLDAVKNADLGRFSTPHVQPRRGAVIGNQTYFTLRWGNAIVKYDWSKNCICMIESPSREVYSVALMEMEDNTLGFACIEDDLSLYLWSRKVRSEGATEWIQSRVIKLDGMIPGANYDNGANVIGYAEGVNVFYVETIVGLFTFELNSGKVLNIDGYQDYFSILPYMSFYTPGCGTLSSLARRVLADL